MDKQDGGPAFPRSETGSAETGQIDPGAEGMSLRDWFAGMAVSGLLASQIHGFTDTPSKGPFARIAYDMADAMLAAREAGDE